MLHRCTLRCPEETYKMYLCIAHSPRCIAVTRAPTSVQHRAAHLSRCQRSVDNDKLPCICLCLVRPATGARSQMRKLSLARCVLFFSLFSLAALFLPSANHANFHRLISGVGVIFRRHGKWFIYHVAIEFRLVASRRRCSSHGRGTSAL